jgi:hypothetical protein
MNADTHAQTTGAHFTDPRLVTVPARDVLAVDGTGAPESPAFTSAIGALFALRGALDAAADVPLEGTYNQDGDPLRFDLHDPDGWRWQLVVPAPVATTAESVAAAGIDPRVRLAGQPEQQVARLVHHGPYAAEQPSLDALYAYVAGAGRTAAGPHTEVYVTDPSTTPPAELRTWLQVPVR